MGTYLSIILFIGWLLEDGQCFWACSSRINSLTLRSMILSSGLLIRIKYRWREHALISCLALQGMLYNRVASSKTSTFSVSTGWRHQSFPHCSGIAMVIILLTYQLSIADSADNNIDSVEGWSPPWPCQWEKDTGHKWCDSRDERSPEHILFRGA